jgi:transcriptional regulator with XRE-family HTH domain
MLNKNIRICEVFTVQISQRIFEVLGKQGLSKADLAKGAGINPRTVGDWQLKGTNPSSDKIASICDFLGVSVEWLLTGEERTMQNSINGGVNGSAFVQGTNKGTVTVHNGQEHTLSEEAAELLRLYEGMNIKKRIKLLQTAIDLSETSDEN